MNSTTSPLVSVIITTYYRNDQLARAIESVISQDYENIEIIVVDDSGCQHAESTAGKYDVNYFAMEENCGPSHCRSTGVKLSNGELIAFLDDDDEYKQDKISRQVKYVINNDVGLVYTGIEYSDGTKLLPEKSGDILKDILKFDVPCLIPSTVLVKATVLKELIPFPNYPAAEDLAMFIEIAELVDTGYISAPLVLNDMSGVNRASSIKDLPSRLEMISDYSSLYNRFDKCVIRTAKSRAYRNGANIILKSHIWSFKSIYYSLLSIHHKPEVDIDSLLHFCVCLLGRPGMIIAKRLINEYGG